MAVYLVLTVLTVAARVMADYDCLCNYNVQWSVLAKASESADRLGDLFEFDCKPIIKTLDGWVSIAFANKVGYVQDDDQIQAQVCQGSPSPDDIVTTKKPSIKEHTTKIIPPSSTITTTKTTHITIDNVSSTHSSGATNNNKTTNKYKTSKPPDIGQTQTYTDGQTSSQKSTRDQTTLKAQTSVYRSTTSRPRITNSNTDNVTMYTKSSSSNIPHTTIPFTKKPETSSTTVAQSFSTTRELRTNSSSSYFSTHRIPTTVSMSTKYTPTTVTPSTMESSTADSILTSKLTPLSTSPSRAPTTQISTSTKTSESTTIKITTVSPTTLKSTTPKGILELSTSVHSPNVFPSGTTIHKTTATTTNSVTGHYAAITIPRDVLKGDISGCPKLPNGGGANKMTQYLDNCYEIMTTSRYSYQFAETHCTIRGGHLVTIPNLVVEEYLRQILQTWFKHPVWIGYNNVSGQAQWTSGSSIYYTNLADQSRVHAGSGDNMSCAVYDTRGSVGVWELHDCTEKFPYICQYQFSGFHSSVAPVTQAYKDTLERCRNKLGIYNNSVQTDGVHCYRSIRTMKMNPWLHCSNVERLCGSSQGYLVRPSTQMLRALVPNNVFVTVPGYSSGRKRFLDIPGPTPGCATLELKSDGLHHVNVPQTIPIYSVCSYGAGERLRTIMVLLLFIICILFVLKYIM